MDSEIIMNLSHHGLEYLVTDEGWFRLGEHGVLVEMPAPSNPYEQKDTEVCDG
jgi:hypothetical protein